MNNKNNNNNNWLLLFLYIIEKTYNIKTNKRIKLQWTQTNKIKQKNKHITKQNK